MVLYSVCIGSLALALTAGAQQDERFERAKPQPRTPNFHPPRPTTGGAMTGPGNLAAVNRQRPYPAPRNHGAFDRPMRPGQTSLVPARDRSAARDVATNVDRNRDRNFMTDRTRNFEPNRDRNTNEFRERGPTLAPSAAVRDRNFGVNRTQNFAYYRGGNARITNNWHGNAFRGQRYAAFRNYKREWHDGGWWRSHYDRIVFVNGGWYYWNAGYWFPAWGYDPYVTYVYDGPIYAYGGFSPDQVTVNVQEALADAGYYDGPIDGVLGPMTRDAIAAFQADNGLVVTSAIDEPTLATMGLV